MKVIYVDDEKYMGKLFSLECGKFPEISLVGIFDDSLDALSFASSNPIDAAFLDISMPKMTGLELSERLRELYPKIVITFISAYDEYMTAAFREKNADYYLLKPYSAADLRSALERAELLSLRQRKKICIETFGRFSVYVDGKHINFTSKNAKELMAILVDKRGTSLGIRQLWNVVFEDEEYNHAKAATVRKALMRLKKILEEAGAGDALACTNGEYRINMDRVDCDYYKFLKGDREAINSFYGEYMTDYSWGEETVGFLTRMCPSDHKCHKVV